MSKSGGFSFGFTATPGTKGNIALRSAAKVNVSVRRSVSLGTKSFTTPGSGIVKVNWKLSRRNLRILKQKKRIRFRATVTVRDGKGRAASGTATLTLRRPR